MADTPSSSKREVAKQLRKQLRKERLEAFRKEPVHDGNILVDVPSKTTTNQQREQNMRDKTDDILKCFRR